MNLYAVHQLVKTGNRALVAALIAVVLSAFAAESGKIAVNDGVDDFLLAAMPPGVGGNYFFPGGVLVTAKYLKEFDARNATRGQLFQVSVAFPLGSP